MTELDRKMLQKRSRNRSVGEEANNSSGENEDFVDQKIGIQDERKPPTARKAMSVKDRVQFKRKKAKVIIYSPPFSPCLDCLLQALMLAV